MDFDKFSKLAVKQINIEVNKLLAQWRSDISKISPVLLPVVDKFIDSCRGGKRIRGILVVLGYQINSKLAGKEIFKIAAAYEIFHSAILAHDDIIDKSLIRRGQPSLFQALGADHRGTSLAICLADAGFFLATKIISEANFPQKEKNEVLKYFSGIMLDTAMGQILDIDKGDNLTIAKYKTAKYTVSGPLVLGAILAGAKLGQLDNLDKFGQALGIAFQVQDDILDNEVDWLGGTRFAKKQAEKYTSQAIKVIPGITKDTKMSKLLEQMAEYLVVRIK